MPLRCAKPPPTLALSGHPELRPIELFDTAASQFMGRPLKDPASGKFSALFDILILYS